MPKPSLCHECEGASHTNEDLHLGGPLMGRLYDDCAKIQQHIETNGLDVFRTRGELAMRCGFLITLVKPGDPDDPAKIRALEDAARDLLGITL